MTADSIAPERLAELANVTKTSETEIHIALAGASLTETDVTQYSYLGSADPGSFDPNPSSSDLEIKGGNTSMTVGVHAQERGETVAVNFKSYTNLQARVANKSTIVGAFTDSTVVTNALTVEAGSGKQLLTVTGAQASLLTTGHYVYTAFGKAGFEIEEERRVKNVLGTAVELETPFSHAPATDALITVMKQWNQKRGGSGKQEWTVRAKTTADNLDTHIFHYPKAVVQDGKPNAGSNSQNMRAELTFNVIAKPEDVTDPLCGIIKDGIFGNELMIPCQV